MASILVIGRERVNFNKVLLDAQFHVWLQSLCTFSFVPSFLIISAVTFAFGVTIFAFAVMGLKKAIRWRYVIYETKKTRLHIRSSFGSIDFGVSLCFWAFILSVYFSVCFKSIFWASLLSFCLILWPLSHCIYFSFVFMFQVWVSVDHPSFIFYLVSFISSSRLIVDICLYFIFIKLVCIYFLV